jgi:hypothetical protein
MASRGVSGTDTTPSPPGIPAELRFIIYDRVLADEERVTMDISSNVLVWTDDINSTALAIRSACKAIHAEATDHFYGNAKIFIRITRMDEAKDNEATPNWAFLALVKTLQIESNVQVDESTQEILNDIEDAC